MKRLDVAVCACTQCIMNGAMDIVESIEGLKTLKTQLRLNATIKVDADKCLCDPNAKNADVSPLVCINGEKILKATSESVTSKIVSIITRG
ncbi:MAG: hypothetical protein RR497_03945 [Oscillospiraceae bacterium]